MSFLASQIAQSFHEARIGGQALLAFPGEEVPASLTAAYAVQDAELANIPRPTGWKVASIRPELRWELGSDRLAGPVMLRIEAPRDGEVEVAVISGGFSAVEAEFVFVLSGDIPAHPSEIELAEAVSALHVGIEIAGSPLATLSQLGPAAVVADHGNNVAVILGPKVPDWQSRSFETLSAHVAINGAFVAEGSAARLPTGGPLGALAWLSDHLAQRGHRLCAGDWIATGAITGVHPVIPGDKAQIAFGAQNLSVTLTARSKG